MRNKQGKCLCVAFNLTYRHYHPTSYDWNKNAGTQLA